MGECTGVEVDHGLCVGSGDCARIAPDAFDVDEAEGVAMVLDGVAQTGRNHVEQAARECPTGAIEVSTRR